MSPLRAATSGATTAWGPFSSPIGTPRLAIRVGAAASTIIRCNGAGGKMRHAARRPHVRSGSRLCENSLEPRTRRIVFSIVFSQEKSPVRSVSTTTNLRQKFYAQVQRRSFHTACYLCIIALNSLFQESFAGFFFRRRGGYRDGQ